MDFFNVKVLVFTHSFWSLIYVLFLCNSLKIISKFSYSHVYYHDYNNHYTPISKFNYKKLSQGTVALESSKMYSQLYPPLEKNRTLEFVQDCEANCELMRY